MKVISQESPGRVGEMFLTKALNKAGMYAFKFPVNGVNKLVVIDSYIPCLNGTPCHSRELWACLFEKAWAKLNGSYRAINY